MVDQPNADDSEAKDDSLDRIPDEVVEALEDVEGLTDEQRKSVVRRVMSVVASQESYRGPIPHPRILGGFENVLPGSADRIIRMAEKQLDHRLTLESAVVLSGVRREGIGLWMAFVLAALCLILGSTIIILGRSAEGLVLVIGAIGTLAGTFIYAQNRRQAELAERRRQRDEQPDDTDLLPDQTN